MYKDQDTFLRKPKMLIKMEAANWINPIKVVKKHLSFFDKEAQTMSKREIVCKVFTKTIPAR